MATGDLKLDKLLDTLEPKLRRQFLASLAVIKGRVDLAAVSSFIEAGNINGAIALVDFTVDKLVQAVTVGFIDAGESTAAFIDGLGVTVAFDQVNQRAVEAMRLNQLRMVVNFTAEQTQVAQTAILRAIERGANPLEAARLFRDSIGLTARQEAAVRNYTRLLEELNREALDRALRDRRFDRLVDRAIRNDQPLTREQIDRMTDRYRERYLKYRSEVIARTEALRSTHQGSKEMFDQAFDDGKLKRKDVSRQWLTAGDERVRGSHNDMDLQERGADEPFQSGDGIFLMYPGDPSAPGRETIQCRCVLTTRVTIK